MKYCKFWLKIEENEEKKHANLSALSAYRLDSGHSAQEPRIRRVWPISGTLSTISFQHCSRLWDAGMIYYLSLFQLCLDFSSMIIFLNCCLHRKQQQTNKNIQVLIFRGEGFVVVGESIEEVSLMTKYLIAACDHQVVQWNPSKDY